MEENKEVKKDVFTELFKVNVNEHTKDKNKLTYLPWTFAWSEVKKRYPDANYEIMKFNGLPYVYDSLTGYMVYTVVTINELKHEMWLPVMDGANKAMKSEPYTYKVKDWYASKQQGKDVFKEKEVESATMFDINKTIMRCLVKNLAMFGLGTYIFAGEDLPEETEEEKAEKASKLEEQNRLRLEKEEEAKKKALLYNKPLNEKEILVISGKAVACTTKEQLNELWKSRKAIASNETLIEVFKKKTATFKTK